jgi:hypothetical protein
MAVNERDPAWAVHADARKKVHDLLSGREDALGYVRALPGHDEATAQRFREGAYYLPVTARTAEAFSGLVFGKTPTRSNLDALDAYLGDVTGSGQDIDRFAEQGFDGILSTGAVMVLVDYPDALAGATKADAEAEGVRPTLKLYDATAILAARVQKVGAALKLSHIRVAEQVEERDEADEFKLTQVGQARVLDLDEAGFYRQRIFRQIKGQWAQFGETVEPKRQNARLNVIPAFFSNPRDGEPSPARPPLDDIAEISVAHLNNSAALEWALLWTANPTPIFKGLALGDDEEIKLGSSEGIAVSADGDAKFMEFTGSGLSELRLALEAKRKDAALMGARMLLETGRAAIAAETARIERAGETSVVSGIANALSDCLTKALTFMADWAGVSSEGIQYWLNTDLNPAGLSAQELTALLAAWQSGAITLEDLFENLQRAEIVDPAKSFEDHREALDEEGEGLGTVKDDAA